MQNFKQSATPCLAKAVLAAALCFCTSSITSAAITDRSVTLSEPSGNSQHFYSEDRIPEKRSLNNADRTTLDYWPVLWLYDVAITFNQDYDGDGFHSNFAITFDFDTHVESTLVYAVLYVGSGNGQWVEYAVTSNFTIGGASTHDAYTIHANFDSGYETGHYDHLIEIYDARSDTFLAEFGPADSHVLHRLPIESYPLDYHRGISTAVSFRFSGTGAIEPQSIGLLLVMMFGLILRRRRCLGLQFRHTRKLVPSEDRHLRSRTTLVQPTRSSVARL